MIKYHPGDWAVTFAFQLKGSVFPRAVAWAAPCAVMTFVLHYVLRLEALVDTLPWMEVGASVMSNFTFVLGFLIVFRVNQAYARWWEGGTLLQKIRGDWFNAYSSLLAFCNESDDSKTSDDVEHFKHTLARLMSLLYSNAIHMVSTKHPKAFECIDIEGLSPDHVEFMQAAPNRCEVILQWIQKLVVEADNSKWIKIAPPILSRVYNQLGDGIVDLNNAHKIAEFPIPFPLAQMVTIMLLYHVFLTCTVCAFSIKTSFWASLFAFVIVFSFQSINYIAVELEDPFGEDDNDLPLKQMTQDMNTSLITLLADRAMTVPPSLHKEARHKDLLVKCVDFDQELPAMASGRLSDREGRKCAKVVWSIDTAKPEKKLPEEPVSNKCRGIVKMPKNEKTQGNSQVNSAKAEASTPFLQASTVSLDMDANLLPVEAQSTDRQDGQLQELPPVATSSAEREYVEITVQNAMKELEQVGARLSEAAGRSSPSNSSAFMPLLQSNATVSSTEVEPAQEPAQSNCANTATLVDASRQTSQSYVPSVAVEGNGVMAAVQGVEHERNNRATPQPVETQMVGRQSGQLLAELDNWKRECAKIALVSPQSIGRGGGQVSVVVSAADESAGREREKCAARLKATRGEQDTDWL